MRFGECLLGALIHGKHGVNPAHAIETTGRIAVQLQCRLEYSGSCWVPVNEGRVACVSPSRHRTTPDYVCSVTGQRGTALPGNCQLPALPCTTNRQVLPFSPRISAQPRAAAVHKHCFLN